MQLVPHDGFSFLRRCIPPRVRSIRRLGGFPVDRSIHLIAHLPTARRCQFARVGDLGPRERGAVFMLWRSVAFRSGCDVRIVLNLVLYFERVGVEHQHHDRIGALKSRYQSQAAVARTTQPSPSFEVPDDAFCKKMGA